MQYSQPRFTKDLDLWLEPSAENSTRVMRAFDAFGMPLIDVTPDDFTRAGLQYMIGRAPVLAKTETSIILEGDLVHKLEGIIGKLNGMRMAAGRVLAEDPCRI